MSQFLPTAIASLDGKTQAGMVLNPFLGVAREACLSAFLMIGLAFHLAGSWGKYIMVAARDVLHLNQVGTVSQNIRSAALGHESTRRHYSLLGVWRLGQISGIFSVLLLN